MRGASSFPTERMTIVVKESPFFRFGWQIVNYASIILVIISILLTFAMIAWYVWRKILTVKQRLKKEVREAEDTLHVAFDKFRDDAQKHLKLLERAKSKRELTDEEEKILKQWKEDLRDAERLVKKEIHDIEREIR